MNFQQLLTGLIDRYLEEAADDEDALDEIVTALEQKLEAMQKSQEERPE